MRIFLLFFFTIACGVNSVKAIGEERYVEFIPRIDSFQLVNKNIAAPILVDSQDYAGVIRAANDFQADIFRVTKIKPNIITDNAAQSTDVVIIGTLGKNRLIEKLISENKLGVMAIRGRWESFLIQVVQDPLPGVKRALVIVGNDKRGAIYGTYDVSEQIGVSPWYWWADVPANYHPQLFIRAGYYKKDEPSVKYRGIFINDEAPALTGWVKEKFGGYNHKFYVKVFELLLRMKANYLWTAMWGNAFYDDDAENAKFADDYGIVIGTSHHEPMQRAHDEWRRYGKGAWNYATNAEVLREFWTKGVLRAKGKEGIITLGMRGDGDEPMSREANTQLLERIVADQRKIIAENINPNLAEVPQLWALYKEVQEYYEKGMRVPDDVTLLWCDDNWGNIRRLPTTEERKRRGGAGVYYHFDYVGGPRSYKWLNTIPITKIWEQMNLAYARDANQIWIVNVGDIKPMEIPTEFFLNMAWNPERRNAENLKEYTRLWASREFGAKDAEKIAGIVAKYTKYNGRRKPELLEPNTYSLVNYREAETVLADYQTIATEAERIYKTLPAEKKDAFYQLVLYPVKACAVINELYITVGKNRLYAVQGRAMTNDMADKARELFLQDAKLSNYYNKIMARGKWNHMMDQTRIGYTYWNQPVRNAMPAVQEVQVPFEGEMGIAIEGSESSLPDTAKEAILPAQNIYEKQPRYFELFNRGQTSFTFNIETHDLWLRVSLRKGRVKLEQRIWIDVDWDKVPANVSGGSVSITNSNNQKIVLKVPIVNPAFPKPEELKGFVETNGYVSIEAEHYTRAIETKEVRWQLLPDFGRTLSAVTTFPSTAQSQQISSDNARLEYQIYFFKEGQISVDAILAPTQNFLPGEGFRYAISFDDEKPQVINVHAGYTQSEWERSVRDGVRVLTSKHTLGKAGYHTLKFWAIDPALVVEKFVVNTGGVKQSYLGPPESFRKN